MYDKLNEKIETTSKFIYAFALFVTIPLAMTPPLIIFAFDYFTNNLTDDSFYVPFPVV